MNKEAKVEFIEDYIHYSDKNNTYLHYPESLRAITDICHQASVNAGWWNNVPDDRWIVPTKLCLIHSEVSEAMEGFRKGLMDDKLLHRPMIEVELADALIRIFDLAGHLQLDLGGALIEKMKYNSIREDHKIETRNAEGGKVF